MEERVVEERVRVARRVAGKGAYNGRSVSPRLRDRSLRLAAGRPTCTLTPPGSCVQCGPRRLDNGLILLSFSDCHLFACAESQDSTKLLIMTNDLDNLDDSSDFPKFDKQKYNRHLRGWFSYAFARYVVRYYTATRVIDEVCSEVFVIVSLTLFLPICLEQFARYISSIW